MHRADYEIYTFRRGDTQYWAFDVEYFGHYVAESEKEIIRKVDFVKRQVALRLEQIERENIAYYARLNRETEKMLQALKERKGQKQEQPTYIDKKELLQQVRDMLLMGATIPQVMDAIPEASMRTISHVRSHLKSKNLL